MRGKFVAALLAAPHVPHVERLGRVHLVAAVVKVIAEFDAVNFLVILEVVLVVSTLGAELSGMSSTAATTMKPRWT